MIEKHFSSKPFIPTSQMYKAGSITARTVIQQHDTIRNINNPNWCTAGICNKHKCSYSYNFSMSWFGIKFDQSKNFLQIAAIWEGALNNQIYFRIWTAKGLFLLNLVPIGKVPLVTEKKIFITIFSLNMHYFHKQQKSKEK